MSSNSVFLFFLCIVPFCSADFLSDVLPQPGATPTDQIKCYALPYGTIGFITHILTYYTLLMLTFGRSPLRWSRIRHYKTDILLGLIGLPLTVVPAAITMVRCRSRWVFYLLAAWKLSLSLMLALTTITTACKVRKGVRPFDYAREFSRTVTHSENRGKADFEVSIFRTLLGLMLYGVGTLMGFVGLVALIKDAWYIPKLRHLTYGFVAVVAAVSVFIGIIVYNARENSRFRMGFFASIGTAIVVFAAGAVIYSDWALAIIAGNLIGTPDGNNILVNVLYWSYFVAKRLPMFSM